MKLVCIKDVKPDYPWNVHLEGGDLRSTRNTWSPSNMESWMPA